LLAAAGADRTKLISGSSALEIARENGHESCAAVLENTSSNKVSTSGLKVGSRVRLVGLVAQPEMNGSPGVVVGIDPARGRYQVELEEGVGGGEDEAATTQTKKPFALKRDNLVLAGASATDEAVATASMVSKLKATVCAWCGAADGSSRSSSGTTAVKFGDEGTQSHTAAAAAAPVGVVVLKTCGKCKVDRVPLPAKYCSPECAKHHWKKAPPGGGGNATWSGPDGNGGGHKAWHVWRSEREGNLNQGLAATAVQCDNGGDSSTYDGLVQQGKAVLMGDRKLAVKLLRRAITMNPATPDAYSVLATALQVERSYAEAAKVMQLALEREAPGTERWGRFTTQLVHMLASGDGKYTRPRPECMQVPGLAPPWFTNFGKQLEMAKRCTEAAPNDSLSWHWRASVHAMAGPKSADAAMCWRRGAEAALLTNNGLGDHNFRQMGITNFARTYQNWADEAESGVGEGPWPGGVWRDDLMPY
jgi:hypothetical protein